MREWMQLILLVGSGLGMLALIGLNSVLLRNDFREQQNKDEVIK